MSAIWLRWLKCITQVNSTPSKKPYLFSCHRHLEWSSCSKYVLCVLMGRAVVQIFAIDSMNQVVFSLHLPTSVFFSASVHARCKEQHDRPQLPPTLILFNNVDFTLAPLEAQTMSYLYGWWWTHRLERYRAMPSSLQYKNCWAHLSGGVAIPFFFAKPRLGMGPRGVESTPSYAYRWRYQKKSSRFFHQREKPTTDSCGVYCC